MRVQRGGLALLRTNMREKMRLTLECEHAIPARLTCQKEAKGRTAVVVPFSNSERCY